ncbi:MAG: ABC transporter substrate-binding protein, partial [Chloroflexota bacterium]
MRLLSRGRTRSSLSRVTFSIALIGSLAWFGSGAASPASARPGAAGGSIDNGSMTLAEDGLASDIDPANNESEYGDVIERNIDETLVRLAGSTLDSFEPDLATSWSSNQNKSVWTFHIRRGVKFHTGRCCVTADDVKYSLGRSVAAQLGGSYMLGRFFDAKNPFKQIKVIDPYTIEF